MSKFEGLVKGRKRAEIPREIEKPKMGRPRAKRSDPEYKQITALVRRDTHIATQRLLIGGEKDFSELLEELLTAWVKAQGKK